MIYNIEFACAYSTRHEIHGSGSILEAGQKACKNQSTERSAMKY